MPININALVNNCEVRANSCVPASTRTVLLNRNGTADQSPACPNCHSWINHWHVMTNRDIPMEGDCATCDGYDENGNKLPIEGCHVMLVDSNDRRVFIAPLCKKCNGRHGAQLTLVKPVTLVWANASQTCGRLQNIVAKQEKVCGG